MARELLPHQINQIAGEARLSPATVRAVLAGTKTFESSRILVRAAILKLAIVLPPGIEGRIMAT